MTLTKFTMICAATLLAGVIASAQTPTLIRKDTSKMKRIQAVAAARIDRNFHIVGPWVPLSGSNVGVQGSVTWVNAWDATNSDPNALPASIYSNYYGVGAGPQFFGDTFDNPLQRNDITLNPSTNGRTATFFQTTNTWNPSGTSPAGGSARMAMALFAGHGFNPATDSLYGVIVDFGVQTGNYYWLQADFSGAGFGIPLPWGSGYLDSYTGTISGSSFVKLGTGVAQADLSNMVAPGEPQFPGTNPSSSGQNCYLDYSPANFALTGGELVSLNYTGSGVGILQPAIGLFVDNARPTISGTCTLEDIDPGTSRPVTSINVLINPAGSGTTISDQWVALGPTGQYSVLAPAAAGNYDVYFYSTHWLRRAHFNVAYSGSSLTGINISCENGDCNGDDAIDIGDYSLLSAAYNTFFGDPTYDIMTDLNHDDAVDIGDYAILSSNYGLFGD